MILLDTNALIWVDRGDARTRSLVRGGRRVHVSPASLLELQFLQEAGRVRLRGTIQSIATDDRWILDEPPATAWFLEAAHLTWTRDPFDRLLAAHARVRRWRLATSDSHLLRELGPIASVEL